MARGRHAAASALTLGLMLLALPGCHRGCDPDPPLPADPRGSKSALAKVQTPALTEIDAEWLKASGGLQVTPAEKEKGDPAYAVTSGELTYQARFEQTMRFAEDRPPVGTRAELELSVHRDRERNARQVVSLSALVLSRLAEGKQTPMNRQPDRRFAPVLLRTTGEQWMEEDGPTSLWSGFGSFPSLRRFFPTLPEDGEIGGIRSWKIVTYPARATIPTERRRGNLKRRIPPTPAPGPQVEHATVTLKGQVVLTSSTSKARRRAWLLDAVWAVDRKTEPPRPRDELARYLGRFVLLDTGQLLYGRIVGNKLNRWSVRAGEQNEQRGEDVHEIRLVAADHGFVLPRFGPP